MGGVTGRLTMPQWVAPCPWLLDCSDYIPWVMERKRRREERGGGEGQEKESSVRESRGLGGVGNK